VAQGHQEHAMHHSREASKAHAAHYGDKQERAASGGSTGKS
jgi:hypothetical protein